MPVAQMGESLQLDTQLRDVLAIFILSYWGLTVQQENLLLGASQTQTQGPHCQNGSWGSTLALHQPPKSLLHQVIDSFNAPHSTKMLGIQPLQPIWTVSS